MLEPFEPRDDETSGTPWVPTRSVLVVIADPHVRQTVDWVLDDLGQAHVAVANWRRAVAATDSGCRW